MADTADLTKKQKRALRILFEINEPAHELQDRPLDVLSDLAKLGMVERKPDRYFHNGKWWLGYLTSLTPYGYNAAAAIYQPEPR